jgi:hypothetical protein
LRRLIPILRNAANPTSPAADAWLNIAFSYAGLRTLGVPQPSPGSFAPDFRVGTAARADRLHDTGGGSAAPTGAAIVGSGDRQAAGDPFSKTR